MTTSDAADGLRRWVTLTKVFVALVSSVVSMIGGGAWWLSSLQADVHMTSAQVERQIVQADRLTAAMDLVREDVATLRSYIPARTAAVDQRLDRLERHVEGLEARR